MHGLSKVQLPPLCDERWFKVLRLFCRVADGLIYSSSVSTHWVSHVFQKLQGDCRCKNEWKWKWSCSVVSDSLRPMGCSPQSSSVHGILQARILEWVAISFSRGSSRPRGRTQVSHIAGRRFNLCATREAKMSKKALLLSFSAHCLGWKCPQEELIHQSVMLGQSRGRWGERVTALALR